MKPETFIAETIPQWHNKKVAKNILEIWKEIQLTKKKLIAIHQADKKIPN